MRTSERLGRSVAKHPMRWAMGVLLLFAALIGKGISNNYEQRKHAAQAKAAEAQRVAQLELDAKARAARALEQKEKCERNLPEITKQVNQLLKNNNPTPAIAMLRDCEPMDQTSPQWALLQRAVQLNTKILAAEQKAVSDMHRAYRASLWPRIGMSPDDVLEGRWGKPEKVNRTTTAHGVREQWVYPQGYLYFVNGRLTTIHD